MRFIISLIVVAVLGVVVYYILKPGQKPEELFGKSFNYYPKSNVYFDITKENYYLLINDKWEQSKTLTEEQKLLLGKYVVINDPVLPVWKENEHHLLVHGTALYSSTEEYQKKYYEDSLSSLPKRSVVPKKDSVKTITEDKKRSGVRNFLDNLFKKKDKKKE